MYICRIVTRNYRNFLHLDVPLQAGVTCIIGENNTGKTNLLYALRLAIDANQSSTYRSLTEQDFHSSVNFTEPSQVLVSLELTDYADKDNETALVAGWEISDNRARITYRFRPRNNVREEITSGTREGNLTLDDYHWELTGGGPGDPATVDWNEELGTSVRFSDLQAFQVVFLPALRDVQSDLRQSRMSPLGRLLSVQGIPDAEKDGLVEILKQANDAISGSSTIASAGQSINDMYNKTAGEAFSMAVKLGMADPSFTSISRALTVLLSNQSLSEFEPARNGLGLNNVLYISMLLEYFERRIADAKNAGQLLLIEEPEAHLHPQLQRVLYSSLTEKHFQTILTTHSTHISSRAPMASFVNLTNDGNPATHSSVPATNGQLANRDVADLERYLDATRSTMLYARKVMLVEGPAELFLIPILVRQVMGIDLDRYGIAVVPIYGVHFDVYSKLFGETGLPKKCAIVADGDLSPSDAHDDAEEGSLGTDASDLDSLKNDFVNVFRCKTTFERTLALTGLLEMLKATAHEFGAKELKSRVTEAIASGKQDAQSDEHKENLRAVADMTLKTAKRIGKARFAQVASKHAGPATAVPKYIKDAVNWLIVDETH